MSILIALAIGVLVGVFVGYLLRVGDDFVLISALAGIVGSILGLALYFLLLNGFSNESAWFFDGRATVCSILGACSSVFLLSLLHRVAPETPGVDPEAIAKEEVKQEQASHRHQ